MDPSGHAGILAAWATKVAVSGAVSGVISGGVSAYTQYKSTGKISWGQVAKDAAVGFVSGAVGAVVGNSIEKKIVGKVASKVLSYVGSGIASAVTGMAERGVGTAVSNKLNPSGEKQNVLKNIFDPRSVATDFVIGTLSYSVSDLYSMYKNGTLKGDAYEMVADFYQNNKRCTDDMAKVADDGAEAVSKELKSLSVPNSKTLRKNLIASNAQVPDYPNAAHHIVAGTSPKAEEARAILQKYGVDINDAANGVFLSTSKDVAQSTYHPSLHTDQYYRTVTDMLSQAESKDDVIDILDDISMQLKNGTFEY